MLTPTTSRKDAIVYWTLTGLLAAFMAFSGVLYLTAPAMEAAFRHLGFPDYFRVELAVAKLLGAAALLLPVPPHIKEWVYAGFGISFISAVIAHLSSGDPAAVAAPPAIAFLILAGSYRAYHRRIGGAESDAAGRAHALEAKHFAA